MMNDRYCYACLCVRSICILFSSSLHSHSSGHLTSNDKYRCVGVHDRLALCGACICMLWYAYAYVCMWIVDIPFGQFSILIL